MKIETIYIILINKVEKSVTLVQCKVVTASRCLWDLSYDVSLRSEWLKKTLLENKFVDKVIFNAKIFVYVSN